MQAGQPLTGLKGRNRPCAKVLTSYLPFGVLVTVWCVGNTLVCFLPNLMPHGRTPDNRLQVLIKQGQTAAAMDARLHSSAA